MREEMVHEFVGVTRFGAGGVGVSRPFGQVTWRRGDKRNALTGGMIGAARRAVDELAVDDGVRAVLLAGEGRSFCAGFDLAEMDGGGLGELLGELSGLVVALRRCMKPVVVGVQGAAVGGGCALLAGGDVVVGEAGCRVGYPVARLGVSPAVSAPMLELAVGRGAARSRLLDPTLIDGEEAKRIGLVHVMAGSADDVVPRAQVEAQRLGEKPAGAFAATKRWVNEVDGSADEGRVRAGLEASLGGVGGAEQVELTRAAIERSGG